MAQFFSPLLLVSLSDHPLQKGLAMKERSEHDTPAYLNHTLPIDERVCDLLARMTLEEKISQMRHDAAALPRLGIPAYNYWNEARIRTAKTDARTMRGAVKSWWVLTGNDGCPTVAQLVAGGVLDVDSARTDPWGTPWRIECDEGEVSVISNGSDRKAGTEDDIRAPPLRRGGVDAPDDTS